MDRTTVVTSNPPFGAVSGLLSSRPLRRPNRTRPIANIEDEIDLDAIRQRAGEQTTDWEQVKDQLGL
jgi:hypothetical protein